MENKRGVHKNGACEKANDISPVLNRIYLRPSGILSEELIVLTLKEQHGLSLDQINIHEFIFDFNLLSQGIGQKQDAYTKYLNNFPFIKNINIIEIIQ